ncbi:hypothetical protein C5167_003282, partial [Papaver somniferum]
PEIVLLHKQVTRGDPHHQIQSNSGKVVAVGPGAKDREGNHITALRRKVKLSFY